MSATAETDANQPNEIASPSLDELRTAAQELHFDLSDGELENYGQLMEGMADSYRLIEGMEAPTLPLKYPRDGGQKPTAGENPLNAWYWRCSIKGAANGKLAGKRIAVKDNVCVGGIPMMNGGRVMEGFTPGEDATVVTRLLDAGAEIVGKSVCENFCFSGGSHTSASGPVLNPHNNDYMTGGSSSGSAALLVAGEVDLAVGGDQGGSIRMPASFSGCTGIKPTYGLVPYTGALAIEKTVDHLGPMAMNTADCALMLEVMAGPDGLDPRQSAGLPTQEYTKALTGDAKGLRIGVVKEGFGTPVSEADVDNMVREAAYRLVDAGATVEDVSIPLHVNGASIMFASILDGTLAMFTDESGAGTGGKGHYLIDAIQYYAKARVERANDMPPTVKNLLMFALTMRKRYGIYYYAKAQNLVRTLRAAYDQALQDYDVLIMPTTPMKAHKHLSDNAPPEEVIANALDMLGNTAPFDSTGHPSMSLPVGLSNGLPVGMMITGRNGEDGLVLRVGGAFEKLG
ncbi:MAG TPA: amidase [Sneathiellales bacterium]|nr:amidase [Sneathiellales bacterium]